MLHMTPQAPEASMSTSSSDGALSGAVSTNVRDLHGEKNTAKEQSEIEMDVQSPVTPSTSPQSRRVGRPKVCSLQLRLSGARKSPHGLSIFISQRSTPGSSATPLLSAKDLMIAAQRGTARWSPHKQFRDDARKELVRDFPFFFRSTEVNDMCS